MPYMQHCTQLQVQQMHDHALCNMQLANSHSHTILNALVHCVSFANFALYFLYHYHLHCIVLCMQHLHCLSIRQGCCTNANLAHAAKQTYLQMQNATFPLVLPPTLSFSIFSLAIRPCTIKDRAFTYTVNCATGSSPAAALLHSALFSLPPCYFGA